MTYQFKGKMLFYIAAFICFLSIILFPFGLIFAYMAVKAKIILQDDKMIYKMLATKIIPFANISSLEFAKKQSVAYGVGPAAITLATVVPLIITQKDGKKTRLSLNYFRKAEEIARVLEEKTGLQIKTPSV